MDSHKFWSTQPIDISKNSIENKFIEELNDIEVPKEPYKLPEKFEWITLDINNDNDLEQIYNFLITYYVDEPNAARRFHYSKEFLKWFLSPPNMYDDLLVGVKYNNKLLATIFGIPMNLQIYDKMIKSVEINFLCVHYSLRNKRLAPLLIKEVTRRTRLHGINNAIYTTSIDLPNSLMKGVYHHRPLNVPKLVELEFMDKPDKISLNGFSKLYKTLESPNINIRNIEERDFKQCCQLLNNFHDKFKVSVRYNQAEFNHQFKFRKDIIQTYVVEEDGKITDFVSFFFIPSKIINNKKYDEMKRAFVYYYANTKTDLVKLIDNGLYFIKNNQIDVVNCINQYDNNTFINKLKFLEGSGGLNFYLFNWICPTIENKDMAIIMI